MYLHDYLTVLRRRWVSALVVALVVIAASAAASLLLPSQYTATTRLFFGVRAGQSASDLAQGSSFTERQMASYEQVATSPLVLDKVVKSLSLDTTVEELAQQVTADAAPGTVVLKISVTEDSAARAADVANAVAQQLIGTVGTLAPAQANGTEAVQATVLAPATIPLTQSSPNVRRNIALGVAFGLLLGIGVALLRNMLDTKIRGEEDVRTVAENPVLGSIALDEHMARYSVFVADEPQSRSAEAIRRLRTNLQFVGNANESKAVVVTSAIAGEGKSTIAMNLAASLADAGARAIIVDANLRRPAVASFTGDDGGAGLSTVLTGQAQLDDVVRPWRDTSLSVLPAGPVPSNPSELLGSAAMWELLTRLTASYDVVLLDTPPLLPVTDATVLTTMVGGAVVVVGADALHRAQLEEALANLETAGGHVYGVVLNKVGKKEAQSHGGGYESYESTATARPGSRALVAGSGEVPALSSSAR